MSNMSGWEIIVKSFKLVARALYNNALDLRYGRPLAGEVPTRFAHLGATSTIAATTSSSTGSSPNASCPTTSWWTKGAVKAG